MKKALLFALVALLPFAFIACNKDKPGGEEDTEITESSLKGTWEGEVRADMAQGYRQKYRIAFNGGEYEMWHMHQEAVFEDGAFKELKDVGDKESGTWEYSDGKLYLKATSRFSSYFISNMSPLEYTFYSYDVSTMEANPWYESPQWVVETLEKTVWSVVSLKGSVLTVKINMDNFALEKKR